MRGDEGRSSHGWISALACCTAAAHPSGHALRGTPRSCAPSSSGISRRLATPPKAIPAGRSPGERWSSVLALVPPASCSGPGGANGRMALQSCTAERAVPAPTSPLIGRPSSCQSGRKPKRRRLRYRCRAPGSVAGSSSHVLQGRNSPPAAEGASAVANAHHIHKRLMTSWRRMNLDGIRTEVYDQPADIGQADLVPLFLNQSRGTSRKAATTPVTALSINSSTA